ncbi:MAG: hypothetical protein HZB38_16935 [Planctomycetes bacterium]|nr:hypothetical protein [Planctomycetota bacterium]
MMQADSVFVRLLLLTVFGLGMVMPRETMPCCSAGSSSAAARGGSEKRSCCPRTPVSDSHQNKHRTSSDERRQCPIGAYGCDSPCCSKAPAPIGVTLVPSRECATILTASCPQDIPPQPPAGGVFHPPRR